jgi:hypothetical protein
MLHVKRVDENPIPARDQEDVRVPRVGEIEPIKATRRCHRGREAAVDVGKGDAKPSRKAKERGVEVQLKSDFQGNGFGDQNPKERKLPWICVYSGKKTELMEAEIVGRLIVSEEMIRGTEKFG